MKTKLILLMLLLSIGAFGQRWSDPIIPGDTIWMELEVDSMRYINIADTAAWITPYIYVDTVEVVMLCADTTTYNSYGQIFREQPFVFWGKGYKVVSNSLYFQEKYLDGYKKELPPEIVVWQSINK